MEITGICKFEGHRVKIYHFSCKNTERYGITVKNLVFLQYLPEYYMKVLISLKTSNFMKIHEISKRHTERYCITVEKLVFFSNFSKISKFPVI